MVHLTLLGLYASSMVVYGSCLYVFGGYSHECTNDLYKFEVNQCKWTKLEIKTRPTARGYSPMIVNQNYLWITGGCATDAPEDILNDMWKFPFAYSILE